MRKMIDGVSHSIKHNSKCLQWKKRWSLNELSNICSTGELEKPAAQSHYSSPEPVTKWWNDDNKIGDHKRI